MRLTEIVDETRELFIEFPSGRLNIRHYPNRFTPELEEQMLEIRDETDSSVGNTFKAALIPVLHSWDLELDYKCVRLPKGYSPSDGKQEYVWDMESGMLKLVNPVDFIVEVSENMIPTLDPESGETQLIHDNKLWRPEFTGETTLRSIPIDKIGLHRVPLSVMVRVMRCINDDLSPEKTVASQISEGSFS